MRGGWSAPTAPASTACSARPTGLDDLGMRFGADLTAAEVRYLMTKEWALTADDVLWRRSKLGLRFSPAQTRSCSRASWRSRAVPSRRRNSLKFYRFFKPQLHRSVVSIDAGEFVLHGASMESAAYPDCAAGRTAQSARSSTTSRACARSRARCCRRSASKTFTRRTTGAGPRSDLHARAGYRHSRLGNAEPEWAGIHARGALARQHFRFPTCRSSCSPAIASARAWSKRCSSASTNICSSRCHRRRCWRASCRSWSSRGRW